MIIDSTIRNKIERETDQDGEVAVWLALDNMTQSVVERRTYTATLFWLQDATYNVMFDILSL